jgi:hypothetical protein
MQSDDAENGGNITFLSSSGCVGTLWWSCYDTYEFTEKKASKGQAQKIEDCELDFENYNIDNENEEYMNTNYDEGLDFEGSSDEEEEEEDSRASEDEGELKLEDESDYF